MPALQTFRLEGVTPERRPPAGPSSLAACPKGSPEPPLRGRGRLRRPRGASTFCRKKWSLWFPPGLPRVLPARVTRAPSPREQRRASPLRFQFPAPDLLRVREFQRLQHALLSETRLPGLGSHRKGSCRIVGRPACWVSVQVLCPEWGEAKTQCVGRTRPRTPPGWPHCPAPAPARTQLTGGSRALLPRQKEPRHLWPDSDEAPEAPSFVKRGAFSGRSRRLFFPISKR